MNEENTNDKASFSDSISGMMNVFIDPQVTARQAVKKGFWIWPLLTVCLAFAIYSLATAPITLRVLTLNPPNNMPPDQFQKAYPVIKAFTYAGAIIGPVFVVLIILLCAWLVMVMCSMTGIQTKFRHVFSLASACSLLTVVQLIASYAVLRMKGDDIQSVQELQPPFGLDIFFSGLKGPLLAIVNYFSIFQIWYILVFGLGLAYMARTTKGKAFVATTPAWVVPLILKVIGSFFQRG
ncbi:MAG TPA: YIP1 family protein [Bryobacteraceae bacterium]|jgi:hypothetical protein|nr:YIP1 family protein [Bryobacteraceae bacterium]